MGKGDVAGGRTYGHTDGVCGQRLWILHFVQNDSERGVPQHDGGGMDARPGVVPFGYAQDKL